MDAALGTCAPKYLTNKFTVMKKFNTYQIIGTIAICSVLVVMLSMRYSSSGIKPVVKEFSDIKLFDAWSNDVDVSQGYTGVKYFDLAIKGKESTQRINEFAISKEKLFSVDYQQSSPAKCFDFESGELIFEFPFSNLSKYGLTQPAGFSYDDSREYILIGDPVGGKILSFNRGGELAESVSLGINFVDFSYSSKDERFIVFAPQTGGPLNSKYGNNAIHVFDKNGVHIESLFPIHDACSVLNFVTSGSFVKYGQQVFFSPPFSGSIFRIYYDGGSEKIYTAPFAKMNEAKIRQFASQVKSASDLDREFVDAVNRELPFEKFLVTDKYFILEKKFKKFPHSIVVDRASGKTVIIGQRMRLPKGDDGFDFFFAQPLSAADGYLLSYFSNASANKILSNLDASGKSAILHRVRAENSLTKNELHSDLLMVYDLNFDFLYQNASPDISGLIPQEIEGSLITSFKPLSWLEVKPNPASRYLNVATKGAAEVFLFSLGGKLMEHIPVKQDAGISSSVKIGLEKFPDGFYLVKVISLDEQAYDIRSIVVSR